MAASILLGLVLLPRPSPQSPTSSPELCNIAQDPSERNDAATQNPEKVAALQKRVNELAATMTMPPLLQIEFEALRKRLAMPPALPGEELILSGEPEARPSAHDGRG